MYTHVKRYDGENAGPEARSVRAMKSKIDIVVSFVESGKKVFFLFLMVRVSK